MPVRDRTAPYLSPSVMLTRCFDLMNNLVSKWLTLSISRIPFDEEKLICAPHFLYLDLNRPRTKWEKIYKVHQFFCVCSVCECVFSPLHFPKNRTPSGAFHLKRNEFILFFFMHRRVPFLSLIHMFATVSANWISTHFIFICISMMVCSWSIPS